MHFEGNRDIVKPLLFSITLKKKKLLIFFIKKNFILFPQNSLKWLKI